MSKTIIADILALIGCGLLVAAGAYIHPSLACAIGGGIALFFALGFWRMGQQSQTREDNEP
jgi:hypothetical protein